MAELRFSPLEEGVLSLLGRWYSMEELQRQLFPESAPESVRSAIAYLRRHDLVTKLERLHGAPLFERTELGTQVLAQNRRRHSNEIHSA